ncbi:MAG: transketolase [Candidatus Colwellbacteria bacterium]|nr:transketolase [Candidatus Colwellbacteria bacterium]
MTDHKKIATEARKKVLEMIYRAQGSHIGSNFSCIDILSALFEKMDLEKDKFILSKGWAAASIYYFLAEKGVIPKEDLERYCRPGEEEYIGLIEPRGKFGLEFAGGSMGYGLPAGIGFALGKKLNNEEGKIHVLLSDGEMQIGTTWESILIAKQYNLSNLIAWIDNNRLQAMGRTKDILDIEPLDERVKSFGWAVQRVDGHNFEKIKSALQSASNSSPNMIICDTIKGKGVSFMENNNLWHYANIKQDDYEKALVELNG